TGKKYYKDAAEAFLKDAARLSPAAASGRAYARPPAVARLLDLGDWAITTPYTTAVPWTSEQQRAFTFTLDKTGWTPDLDGYPSARLGLDPVKTKVSPTGILGIGPSFTDPIRLMSPADTTLPPIPVAI